MILSPEVLTIYIVDVVLVLFSTIAFFNSLNIYFKWNYLDTTSLQYKLEKRSILISTIIKYISLVKLLLFIFFVFTLDNLSNVLTGAMCAAGVVDATIYGNYLFILKIINLYLLGFWIVLNSDDYNSVNLKYTKLKSGLYIFIYFLLMIEIYIEYLMFSNIDPSKIVSCCGTLYSSSEASYISELFSFDTTILLGIFYLLLFLMIISYLKRVLTVYIVLDALFTIIAVISLIMFFSTYIYELPTHHCPFCFLQSDYYYVGYVIYILLFLGSFYGFISFIGNRIKYMKYSLYLFIGYTLLISFYPIRYYILNGVWL